MEYDDEMEERRMSFSLLFRFSSSSLSISSFPISFFLSNERNNYLSFLSVSSSSPPLLFLFFPNDLSHFQLKRHIGITSSPPSRSLFPCLRSLARKRRLSQSPFPSFSPLIAAFVFKNNTQVFYFKLNFFNQFFSSSVNK